MTDYETYKKYKEHVRQAEELLKVAEKAEPSDATLLVGKAQVHATIARALAAERQTPPPKPHPITPDRPRPDA